MDERRHVSRRTIRIESACDVTAMGNVLHAVTRDIGPKGLRLSLLAEIPVGTRIDARFVLPGVAGPLNFAGEVVWCRPFTEQREGIRARAFELGLRFVDLTAEAQEALRHFTEAHPPT